MLSIVHDMADRFRVSTSFVLGRIEHEQVMSGDIFVARTGSARSCAGRSRETARSLAPAVLRREVPLLDRIGSLQRHGREFSAQPSIVNFRASVFLFIALLCAGGAMSARIAVAQTNATSFEVASIRPSDPDSRNHDLMWRPGGRLDAVNIAPAELILDAYDIDPNQLVGLPSWARSKMYTIRAVAPAGVGHLPPRDMIVADRQMLQSLLADRFGLRVHRATKQLPVYELVVTKRGAKLKAVSEADWAAGSVYRKDHPLAGGIQSGPGMIIGWGEPMSDLARALTGLSGRLVVDKTGLTGRYDFNLTWTPLPGGVARMNLGAKPGENTRVAASPDGSSHTLFFTALQEQLGLKLKSTKGPVQVLVVDRIEPPTPN